MYFCEDSASEDDDDGRGTVRHFSSGAAAAAIAKTPTNETDAAQPAKSSLAPLLLFQEAEATRSCSAPNSPRPSPANSSTAAAVAAASGVTGGASGPAANRRQRNASVCSQEPQRTELSPQRQHQKIQSKSQQLQHQQVRTPSSTTSSVSPPPPPYPEQQSSSPGLPASGSASAAALGPAATPFATVNGGGIHDGFLLPQTTAAFQEVREISLGRHNEEPYGMKVESIGEAFYITHVVRNSVAACAGLKVGDEIVRINDRRLDGLKTREVLQIIRQSEVCVKLAFKPRAVVARIREVRLTKDNGVLGLRLQKKPDGLYIDFVKAGTVAHGAGLKDGDQVLKINSHIVTDWSMEGAMALLKSLSESEPLQLLIRETLPLAHVASRGASYQPAASESRGQPRQQQQQNSQFLRRQGSAAVETHHQNGVAGLGDGGCGPSERTASCSRLGETGDASSSGAVVRRALGTNPCASTDDLEITQLPMEMDNQRGASASASGSTSSFFKSSKLTSFLRSARFSRHGHQSPRQAAALSAASGRDRGTS